jgi:hypothetical protein
MMSLRHSSLTGLTAVAMLWGIAVHQSALAQTACSGDWITVSDACPLPADLVPGDEIQITVGSALHTRQQVVAASACDGESAYLTSDTQAGCGWRRAITAYRRAGGTIIDTGITGTTALEAQ